MANVSNPSALLGVDLLAAATGDLVAIRSRRLYLSRDQAVDLAGLLLSAVQKIDQRCAAVAFRRNPFPVERLLLSLDDSCEQGTPAPAKTGAGEIPPLVRCPHEPCSSCVNEFICGLTPVKEILK